MKNLKKVLALVLALSMILSTFTALTITASAAAEPTFSDIAGTSYEDAVEVLAALGIVAGYEDGTFGGDKTVTRAEMAAFIVRELGLSATANSATAGNQFTDVAADHWALGSINVATQKKIIVGNGDGTFAPNDTVSYQAAVKMLVCALGYEVVANRNGGWPNGYLIQGAALGLTDGITGIDGADGCNRGVVASLLFNALEIDLMEETAYSNSAAQVEETYKTLLYDYLKVVKYYDAEITATPTQGASKTAAGYAKLAGSYDYYGNEGLVEKALKVEIGETDPDAFFGSTVIIYCKDNGSNKTPTMLCIIDDTATQDSLTVNVADFYSSSPVLFPGETNTEGTNNTKYVKLYYKTENDTKAQSVKLLDTNSYSENCQIVINGVVNDSPDWTQLATLQNGTIKLVDAKSYDVSEDRNYMGADGIYEKVIVDTYINFVVDEVDTEDGIVSTKNGVDITLDESKTYSIKDSEGNELKVEDLKEFDVLSVYCDEIVDEDLVDDSEVINIVVYSNPVEGKVTEKTSKAVFVDDQKYEIAGSLITLGDFELDDEGTFYLNAEGEIVYIDTTAASKDYAVFYNVIQDTNRKVAVEVITSAGEDLELELSGKIDVVTYAVEGTKYAKQPKVEFDLDNGEIDAALAALSVYDEGAYAPYVASYTLKSGSDTKIDTIYLAGDPTGADTYATRFALWADDVKAYYNKNESTLGAYSVDDSTVIFDIPEDVTGSSDADEISVYSKSGLTNNKTYNHVSVYDVDKNNVAKAVVLISSADKVDMDDPIAVIQGITSSKNADGDDVFKIYMIEGGKLVSKITEDKDVLEDYGTATLADGYDQYTLDIGYGFYPGAVIMYNEAGDGAIDNVLKVYPIPSKTGAAPEAGEAPYYKTEFFTTWNNSAAQGGYSEGADCFIIYGKVVNKNTTNKTLTIESKVRETQADDWTARNYIVNYGSANITVVDYAFEDEDEKVTVGSISDVKEFEKEGSYVLVRKKDGTTKDIVVYKNSFNPDEYVG